MLLMNSDNGKGGLYVGIILGVILFITILSISLAIAKDRKWKQCSQCKKKGALVEIERKEIKRWTEHKTVKDRKPIFDKDGKDTGKYIETEKDVPEEHILYDVEMKCKHCGNIETKKLDVKKITIGAK